MSEDVKPDVQQITGYLGKSFRALIGRVFVTSDITKTMTPVPNLKVTRPIRTVEITGGLRQLNTAIETPKGRRKFGQRELVPRGGMKILRVIPEEYRDTYLAEQLNEDSKDISEAAFIWGQEFGKVQEEYVTAFYNGKYVVPQEFNAADTHSVDDYRLFKEVMFKCISAASAGQTPETNPEKWIDVDANVILDGPGTVLAEEITDGQLIPIATGAITESNSVAKHKEMWKALPEEQRNTGKYIIYESYDQFENYQSNYNALYGTGKGIPGSDLDTTKAITVKGTAGRLKIQPCKWMGTSNRLIMTPQTNMFFGFNNSPEHAELGKIIEKHHGFEVSIKHMSAFNFGDLGVLYVNDQD